MIADVTLDITKPKMKISAILFAPVLLSIMLKKTLVKNTEQNE
jgi:hypothetical protein